MKIASLQISDVKRVRAVSIEPKASGVTVIGGRNGQGKTSVLSAIMYALGGERYRPGNFKREGSLEDGYIKVTFDNGIIAERKGKNAALRVVDPTGKRAGQELLKEFVSQFAIDLPKFMNADDREKANILLRIIGLEDELMALDAEETAKYEERTLVGREADRERKFCEEMPFHPDVPEQEVSAADLLAEQQAIMARNAGKIAARDKVEQSRRTFEDLVVRKIRLVEQRAALSTRLAEQKAELEAQIRKMEETYVRQDAAFDEQIAAMELQTERLAEEIADTEQGDFALESTEDIERRIRECEAVNAKVRDNAMRKRKLESANAKQNEYDGLTQEIEDCRRRRKALLDGADLPYPGLSVQNGILYLNGKAWDSCSGSEQLIVGCAVARKINPNCGFVLMDKLEQFDLETLERFDSWCEKENLQTIATRVSTGPECEIIIEDGCVAGQPMPEIEKTAARDSESKCDAMEEEPVPCVDESRDKAMAEARALLERKRAEASARKSA